jgi:purine nucleosidase
MPPARKLIIDCDPGQDDAIMLLMALARPDAFEVLGITTVAGNVPLELTQRNARLMCDLAGAVSVPVFAGCGRPMVRELITAENVHGKDGIDGMEITEPRTPLQPGHAVDFIVERLRASGKHAVTLVPTGPLTNVGTAIERAPDILDHVDEIVLMGGALREGGNRTPSAEFNILVDPHAAQIVLGCGRPITMAPLDVTHQVMITPGMLDRIRKLTSPAARATAGMLNFFNRHDIEKYRGEGAPLHDPCTIAWLLRPELFAGKHINVEVEIASELTAGHTAVDFWEISGRPPNVNWLYEADRDGFFDLLIDCLQRYE